MIFPRDFITRDNFWQTAPLVTQKTLFAVTHALFYISHKICTWLWRALFSCCYNISSYNCFMLFIHLSIFFSVALMAEESTTFISYHVIGIYCAVETKLHFVSWACWFVNNTDGILVIKLYVLWPLLLTWFNFNLSMDK